MPRQAVQERNPPDRLRTYPSVWRVIKRLHVVPDNPDVGQTKLTDTDFEKVRPPLPPLNERDLMFWERQRQHDTGQPDAGAEVQDAVGRGEARLEQLRINSSLPYFCV